MRRASLLLFLLLALCRVSADAAPDHAPAKTFAWPTAMRVTPATPWGNIVQPAASGVPATALFGFARNGGTRFHEGIDIRPTRRDKNGEPRDKIFAALAGTVAHIVPSPNGAYGRYVVLSHKEKGLSFYTLYAHMSVVSPKLRIGAPVFAGNELGTMGRSDHRGGFPKERAHLHFEVGLVLSRNFDRWYVRQKDFDTPNKHGNYNGFNLTGTDPLPFLRQGLAAGKPPSLATLLKNEEPALTVFVSEKRVPNFVLENPALVTGYVSKFSRIAGWKIEYSATGLPLRWTPLTVAPGAGAGIKSVRVSADKTLRANAVKRGLLAARKNGTLIAGESLKNSLEMLFQE